MLRTCRNVLAMAGALVVVTIGTAGCPTGGQTVFFTDSRLEAAIRQELHQPFGFLTVADLQQLTKLEAKGSGITNLSGLEHCENITWLDLDSNAISDITPLANLTNLMVLNLDNTEVFDLSPLAGLLHLDTVTLRGTPVTDIQALVTNAVNGGLGEGDLVAVDGATLSDDATANQVPALQDQGVNVDLGDTSS